MITRWEMEHLDLRMVVKDAIKSGRLPLAVLQLHIPIAYDLFLNGESGLIVATLQKLGEDIEIILKQLFFGTVSRSLRAQIADEMKTNGSSWVTFLERQKEITDFASSLTPESNNLKIALPICDNLAIECGDINGVVCGLWASGDNGSTISELCGDNSHAG
ncbi:hypothetical protein J5N97_013463 [Dioscorea zingiberensis]|uniref:Uncharacterized protein n=1 Tax=Dioscorea zingiberensis TaxID=325984 RepID=A0A9D5HIT5_9LILI|nr:hypothetical protein J5N97_013463 [Dioscorea zingiberensis]